ncbi:MAG: VWA domain-containing protein [Planctomycetaceae bacterium]|nr:VWA domain-containing protein [Planctomycetaceae bacterium]
MVPIHFRSDRMGELRGNRSRRGAAHILIASMLIVFVIAAALTIDLAYMQLIRTELRAATDAAAKAGAEALVRTQNEDEAVAAAVRYARMNRVAGKPFQIRPADVSIGRVTVTNSGSYRFTEHAVPSNAIRVNGQIGNRAATQAVPLFFSGILGAEDFSTSRQATAARQEVEVCLSLDRSGSMLFDMSGEDYSYPKPNPNLSTYTDWGEIWQYHLSPPHPTRSRWVVLADAIGLFLDEAERNPIPPRTSLVTWVSDYMVPLAPYQVFPAAESDVPLPRSESAAWTGNRRQIEVAIEKRTRGQMLGGTNMSAGIDRAVQELTGPNSQRLSNKVVILLTDGQWNDGRDPLEAARDAAAQGITIHTVTMLSSDPGTMRRIAEITGGNFYQTSNQMQLRAAFQELARSLPVVLTE